jgi:hypothetical protein
MNKYTFSSGEAASILPHLRQMKEITVLKSRAWVIAVIAIGALVALAIGTGIYVFLQMQQGVIV